MIFAKERAEVICAQLKKFEQVNQFDLTAWQMKKGNFLRPSDADASEVQWQAFDSRTMHWYGPDGHYWFRTEYTVPECEEGKSLWMILHTQIDEWDDGKNPQFLLFVDGEITQGMDMNHREVLLTKSAKAGQTYHFDIQSHTGTLHTEFQLLGEIAEISEPVRRLYYDLQVPLWALDRMNPQDKTRIDFETILNDTINLLDLRQVHSEAFYQSVDSAHEYINQKLYKEMGGYDDVIATCIGHTHIDVAWWWTVAQTREKVARSFATVLKLMDEYPDYKFISSQPQLYVFLKERYPELYAKVKERVKEGRWEAEGGMWLEADCNLTSGESLVRQFLYGKRFFKEEFGVDNRVLWLPDVFGYSGALPQIMKKCGIDYFMTTKLSWNQFNKVPNDTLMWEGIDGTGLLTHFISTLGVGQSTDRFFTTYNGMLHPDAIMGGWERYQNKEMNNDILISYGYGDGGGGPTRAMLETGERMEKGIKGVPKVRQAFAGQYFSELEARVKDSKRLSTWTGEFYFEYHRGTYTSMARNKRANRKSELMLMDLELISVLAQECGVSYPEKELESMWKTVLLNQFHDILPGSSIHEVYEVTKQEYEAIHQLGTQLLTDRITALTGSGNAVTVYNTLGFVRNDVVALGDCSAKALQDEAGNIYPVQQTADGAFAYLNNLPSKGWKAFAPTDTAFHKSPFKLSDHAVETPYYLIAFDENGNISSLYDKEHCREVVQRDRSINQLRVFEDKPIYYDNWDIDIFYHEKYWDVNDKAYMRWTEDGPVEAVLEIERPYSKSLIRQKIHFYAQSRRIDFETYVDWHESQHLMKVLFPCDVHTDEATFDIQFGNVTRKTHTNTSWDMARFESCGHKWADVSEGGYGVALLNDCKYGYSAHEGEIDLTLIKSGIEPNATTDQEEHFFTYSIYPHAGAWRQSDVPQEAYKLNQPSFAVNGGKAGEMFSLIACDHDNVVLETVKKAENSNDVIVRAYENRNMRTDAAITLGKPVQRVSECDLLENSTDSIDCEGNQFTFTIRPYEIKTFLIQF